MTTYMRKETDSYHPTVSLGSTELFHTLRLIVLVFHPTTCFVYLHCSCQSCFQPQQATVFRDKALKSSVYYVPSTEQEKKLAIS